MPPLDSISSNEIKLVREYIVRGCAVNTGDGEGLTALHYACLHNHPDMIQFLADFCGDKLLRNPRDKSGCTPLYWACYMGHQEAALFMIKLGGDVHIRNLLMKSCLHAAVSRSNLEIAQLLTATGAEISIKDAVGWTVYHEAAVKTNDAGKFMDHLKSDLNEPMKIQLVEEQIDALGYAVQDYYRIFGRK